MSVTSYKQVAKAPIRGIHYLFNSVVHLFPIVDEIITHEENMEEIMRKVERREDQRIISNELADKIEQWVLQHKQNLEWDKEHLVYILKDADNK